MLQFLASFFLWALLHSLTASASVKAAVRKRLGERTADGFYRFGYNIFAVVTLLPTLYFWLRLPNTMIWRMSGAAVWLFNSVRLLALLGAAVSLIQTDLLDFIGLRQILGYFSANDPPAESRQTLTNNLVVGGFYRWVRHPLYTFSLLLLWATPTLSLKTLLLNLAFSAYFIIGSIYEERRLVGKFGAAYVAYQKRVGRFLPRPW